MVIFVISLQLTPNTAGISKKQERQLFAVGKVYNFTGGAAFSNQEHDICSMPRILMDLAGSLESNELPRMIQIM